MPKSFLYMRPDERAYPGSVSGSVDADFVAAHLIDGRPSFPVKKTGGSISLAVTPDAARNVNGFAAVNHAVRAAVNIAIGGIGTLTPSTWGEDGIPFNPFQLLTAAVALGTPTVSVTGNVDPVIIGDLWLGTLRTLDGDFLHARQLEPGEAFTWESALAPYDDGESEPRRLSGSVVLSDSGFADLQAWYRSTRRGARPSVVVPDSSVNDAWLAVIQYREAHTEGWHMVELDVLEIPRTRW